MERGVTMLLCFVIALAITMANVTATLTYHKKYVDFQKGNKIRSILTTQNIEFLG